MPDQSVINRLLTHKQAGTALLRVIKSGSPPLAEVVKKGANANRMALTQSDVPWNIPGEGVWDGRERSPIDEKLQTIEQTSWLGFQFFQQRLSDRIPAVMQDVVRQYRSWIYVCCNKRANAVASTAWHLNAVWKRGQKMLVECKSLNTTQKQYLKSHPVYGKMLNGSRREALEVLDHPFLDLMSDGNEVSWSGQDIIHLSVLCLSLVGNAFWYMPSDSLGIPHRLFMTLPHLTWVIPNFVKGGALVYGTGGSVFRNEEIAHFACPSPLSTWQGFGAGDAAWFTMKRLEKAEEFENSLQTNGIFPSGIISPDEILTDDQMKYVKEWLQINHAGVRKAGKIMALPWPAKMLAPQIPTEAIRFLADHSVSRDEICAIFGVPVAMVAEPKSAANAYWATQQFTSDAVKPDCKLLESCINRKIISRYQSDKKLFFAFDNPCPQDEDAQIKRLRIGMQGQSVKRNEIRAALNSLGGVGVDLPEDSSPEGNEYVGGAEKFNSRPPKEMDTVIAPDGTRDGEAE